MIPVKGKPSKRMLNGRPIPPKIRKWNNLGDEGAFAISGAAWSAIMF
jgi:hypothetical protein